MATFDRDAALAAGYTPDEIDAFLSGSGAANAATAAKPAAKPAFGFIPRPEAATENPGPVTAPGANWRTANAALGLLPAVGSGLGGALGGAGGTVFGLGVGGLPGAIGGAGAGGAGGEALRELISRALGMDAPATPQEAMASMGTQAGLGMASELGGRGLMAAGERIAPALARAGLRMGSRAQAPTVSMGRAFPKVDFPGTMLKEGISDAATADAARQASASEAHSLVERAAANNPTDIAASQTPDDVRWIINKRGGLAYGPRNFAPAGAMRDFFGDLMRYSSQPKQDVALAKEYVKKWVADNAERVTPAEWYDAAKGLQTEAQEAFLNDQGQGAAGQALNSDFMAKVKQKLSQAIKQRLGEDIQGLTSADARTQSLMALEKALERAQTIRPGFTGQMAPLLAGGAAGAVATGSGQAALGIPAALATGAEVHMASDPTNLAKLAIAARPLGSAAGQAVERLVPRALGWAAQSGLGIDPAQLVRGGAQSADAAAAGATNEPMAREPNPADPLHNALDALHTGGALPVSLKLGLKGSSARQYDALVTRLGQIDNASRSRGKDLSAARQGVVAQIDSLLWNRIANE